MNEKRAPLSDRFLQWMSAEPAVPYKPLPKQTRIALAQVLIPMLVLDICLALWMKSQLRSPGWTPVTWGLLVVACACAVFITRGIVRVAGAGQYKELFIVSQALLGFSALPAALMDLDDSKELRLFRLLPLALVVWSFVGFIRTKADELQKRIIFEGLAIAYIATLTGVVCYGTAEKMFGIPRASAALWAIFLIIALGLGYLFAARRYRA